MIKKLSLRVLLYGFGPEREGDLGWWLQRLSGEMGTLMEVVRVDPRSSPGFDLCVAETRDFLLDQIENDLLTQSFRFSGGPKLGVESASRCRRFTVSSHFGSMATLARSFTEPWRRMSRWLLEEIDSVEETIRYGLWHDPEERAVALRHA